jgi:hypothetical protein
MSARNKKSSVLDDLVASATQFTRYEENRSMTLDAKQKAADEIAARINSGLRGHGRTSFKLTGPAQLTIKTRQSQYKKKAFLGDEEMALTSAYAGKRGDVIAVFKNNVPTEYAYIEIPLMEARERLSGFSDFIAALNIEDFDKIVDGIEQGIAQAAAVEREEAMAESPEFGSW